MKTVHFIGIGGYGMSAIAKVVLERGDRVTGSDVASSALGEQLAAAGAEVHIGHDARYVESVDEVVYSTAIRKDHPELVAARQAGIPVLHRAQKLAELLHEKLGIAVAGAHGKTTTSSMITHVLRDGGLDPTFIVGGEVVNAGTNASAGTGQFTVAEADESDGSFLHYFPWGVVVTNIEADHLEHYDGNYANLQAAYVQFVQQTKPEGIAVLCLDDAFVREIANQSSAPVCGYGLEVLSDGKMPEWSARKIQLGDRTVSFEVLHQGTFWGAIRLVVPGKHNVSNALATIAIAVRCGLDYEAIRHALSTFGGAKRRFQVIGESEAYLIVDDYAHHPTEIEATLRAAKTSGRRVFAIFQPQRYTRTYFLFDEFARAFMDSDALILTDIYSPAGEEAIEGVSSRRLIDRMKELGTEPSECHHVQTLDQALQLVKQQIRTGDLVITMGAGDVWKVAKQLWALLQESMQERVSPRES